MDEEKKKKKKEIMRQNRLKNKEKISNYNKQYRINNLDSISSRMQLWRDSSKELISSLNKDYYSKNKENISKKRKNYNNEPEVKEQNSIRGKLWRKDPDITINLRIKNKIYLTKNLERIKNRIKTHRMKPWIKSDRKNYRIRNWREYLINIAKSRSTRRNITFSITKNDIIDPNGKKCPCLDTKFIQSDKKSCDDSATLDRIDNSLGYIPGNVWVISSLANRIKHECDHETLFKIGSATKERENDKKEVVYLNESTKRLRVKMVKNKRCSNRSDRKLEFSITWENISLPDFCPCTGAKIDYDNEFNNWRNWPTIDRIDNSLGYIPGNVWVISMLANTVKTTATGDQILAVAKALKTKIHEMYHKL